MRSYLSIVLLSSVSLVACGGDDDGDGVTPVIDAAPGGGNIDAAPAACTVSTTSFGDKGAMQGSAILDTGMNAQSPNDDTLVFFAPLEGGVPGDLFYLELYADYGAYAGGPVRTGSVTISGDETQYADCGACARVLTDAQADGNYTDDYLATGGTVNVTATATAVGQTLSGSISNLALTHVTILDAAPYTSTPAGDNCNTMIMNGTFSGMTMAPPMGGLLPSLFSGLRTRGHR